MDDLAAMRKASRKVAPTKCAVCELEAEMTSEHQGALRRSYEDSAINTAGRLTWVRDKYPDARLLTLKAPGQCLRRHKECLGG